MPVFLMGVGATAHKFTVGGVDLTDHVKSLSINENYDDIETTAFNSVSKTHTPGLRDDQWEIEFFQDYDSSKVNATIGPLLGDSSGATLIFQSNGSTVTTAYPKWTMIGAPFTWSPIGGSVGEASMTSVTFLPVAGSYTVEATS